MPANTAGSSADPPGPMTNPIAGRAAAARAVAIASACAASHAPTAAGSGRWPASGSTTSGQLRRPSASTFVQETITERHSGHARSGSGTARVGAANSAT
jgi:hypothetical protein